jgi:hypothetical protein
VELTGALMHGGYVIFDTSVPRRPGGFDAADGVNWMFRPAAHKVAGALLLLDSSAASEHVAEEVIHQCRDRNIHRRILGAVCGDGHCLSGAIAAITSGHHWIDPHLRPDFLGVRPVLYTELGARNVLPEIMVATAASPMSWTHMARLLSRDYASLRSALGQVVRPAITRLGWIEEHQKLLFSQFAALVHERRAYFPRYVDLYRPQLAHLTIGMK